MTTAVAATAQETFDDLLTITTNDEEVQALKQRLAENDWPVTAWESGDVGRTLVEATGLALSELSRTEVLVTQGGFVLLAFGPWLDLVAQNVFFLEREGGVINQFVAVFSLAATASPQTIAIGDLVAQIGGTYLYSNATPVAIAPGGTALCTFQAQQIGAAYNQPDNATTLVLTTPIAGLSISNPPQLGPVSQAGGGTGTITPSVPSGQTPTQGSSPLSNTVIIQIITGGGVGSGSFQYSIDGGNTFSSTTTIASSFAVPGTNLTLAFSGTFDQNTAYEFECSSIVQQGTDQESDADLQQRCLDQWGTLGTGSTEAAYKAFALGASDEIRRVDVPEPPGNGDVVIYIGGETSAPVSTSALAACQASVDDHKPINDEPQVIQLPAITVALAGTIYYSGADPTAAIQDALNNFANGLELGGSDLGTGTKGIAFAQVLATIMSVGPALPKWKADQLVRVGFFIVDPNGNMWLVRVPGLTGEPSPPVWPKNPVAGQTTVVDNEVTWVFIGQAPPDQIVGIDNVSGLTIGGSAADYGLNAGQMVAFNYSALTVQATT